MRRIAVIACGARKRAIRSTARELYTGSLFVAARRDVDGRVPWWVISGLHGILAPDAEVEPYEFKVTQIPAGRQRDLWARQSAQQLAYAVNPPPPHDGMGNYPVQRLDGYVVELHAGATYVTPLRPALEEIGAVVEVLPPGNLELGARLAWYAERRRRNPGATMSAESIANRIIEAITRSPPPGVSRAYVVLYFRANREQLVSLVKESGVVEVLESLSADTIVGKLATLPESAAVGSPGALTRSSSGSQTWAVVVGQDVRGLPRHLLPGQIVQGIEGVAVRTLRDASKVVQAFVSATEMGMSAMPPEFGAVVSPDGRVPYNVSYNGRVWHSPGNVTLDKIRRPGWKGMGCYEVEMDLDVPLSERPEETGHMPDGAHYRLVPGPAYPYRRKGEAEKRAQVAANTSGGAIAVHEEQWKDGRRVGSRLLTTKTPEPSGGTLIQWAMPWVEKAWRDEVERAKANIGHPGADRRGFLGADRAFGARPPRVEMDVEGEGDRKGYRLTVHAPYWPERLRFRMEREATEHMQRRWPVQVLVTR